MPGARRRNHRSSPGGTIHTKKARREFSGASRGDIASAKAASASMNSIMSTFYEKPFLKFDRILHTYLTYAPVGLRSFLMAIPLWIRERIWMKELIRRELGCDCKVLFPEHHESHAASAFFPSPYPEAAFLTWMASGNGQRRATVSGRGQSNRNAGRSYIFRTRSGCFIPRSLISPDSGSIPANTS